MSDNTAPRSGALTAAGMSAGGGGGGGGGGEGGGATKEEEEEEEEPLGTAGEGVIEDEATVLEDGMDETGASDEETEVPKALF